MTAGSRVMGDEATASRSVATRDVMIQVYERDIDSVFDSLDPILADHWTINTLLYSDVPTIGAAIHRLLGQTSADQQYDLLEQWTLKDVEEGRLRVLVTPVPTDAPPSEFAREIGQRPRDSTFATSSIGPVEGLFCSGWSLALAADELGRLSRLRVTLAEHASAGRKQAEPLLMLSHLAGSRGDLQRVQQFLQTEIESLSEASDAYTPDDVLRVAVAAAALQHSQTQQTAEQLLRKIVNRNVANTSIGLRSFLRTAHAAAVQVCYGESDPATFFQNRLKYWTPVTVRSATDLRRGRPEAIWLTHQQHLLHLAGGNGDLLLCRFPLTGEFDFVCETQEGGSEGTDGGLVYGGLQFQTLGRHDELTVWDADIHHRFTRHAPFARFDSRPVFNHVSIRSDGDGFQYETNFHPVWRDHGIAHQSPWIGLRSSGTQRPVFRNLQFSGTPTIPREVRLLGRDQLRGWQTDFFAESQPLFQETAAVAPPPAGISPPRHYDWQPAQSHLLGNVSTTDPDKPGRIIYQRPLLEDESMAYEFLYEGDASIPHPSVGRIAFLLEPRGIRLRWITTGEREWTGLARDNALLEPLNRRGRGALPLKQDQWNRVQVQRQGTKVALSLNDQLVYERSLDDSDWQFGLYRPTRKQSVTVRNVVLTGPWPQQVPAELLANPLARQPPREASR